MDLYDNANLQGLLRRDLHTPLYHQLRQLLREQIQRGELRDGQQLPREEDLAKRLGISRVTVRLALARGVKGTAEDEVVIFRSLNQDKITAYVVDVGQIQDGNIGNPTLIGGDTVHVARSGTTVFFDKVLGFVRFGAIPLGG